MAAFTTQPGQAVAFLKESFPWDSLGNATIVDVGGSGGHISIELARAFPSLNFIVQDRIEVVEKVKDECPTDVESRIQFMAHDFFEKQPVEGDVYLFRWIFHNWPDKYVIQILRQLVGKLKPGGRVLINDHILPDPNTMSLTLERHIR
jgi:precorrin-6B methylase 2